MSCKKQDDGKSVKNSQPGKLQFADNSIIKQAKDLRSSNMFPEIEKLEVRYCDIKNKKIYFSLRKNSPEIFWAPINIDSSFKYNLTNQNEEDIIYLGKFKLHQSEQMQISFVSIYSMNPSKNEYSNIFNDFYFTPDPTNFIIKKSNYFIDSTYNALIIGFNEGSGDFFEYKIYGFNDNTIKILYEPHSPIQNGTIYSANHQIYEFENLSTSLLYWENNQVKSLPLRKTLLIDLREGDAVLEYKINDEYEIQAPSRINVSSSGKLQLVQNGYGQSISVAYDDQFFEHIYNQLIPKKKGTTTIMLESEFGEIEKQITVVIN